MQISEMLAIPTNSIAYQVNDMNSVKGVRAKRSAEDVTLINIEHKMIPALIPLYDEILELRDNRVTARTEMES